MKLPNFDYACPHSLEEAISLLAGNDGAMILAGGQSLIPVLAFRLAQPSLLVDIRNIGGIDSIAFASDGTRVGAKVRWRQVEEEARLLVHQPLFQFMISHVAHYQIRNRGTVGGSLAHADPAAEMPGVAVVCDCVIRVVGLAGVRDIPAEQFFAGPLETTLDTSEIITEVKFPPWPERRRWSFQEFARRRGDFAIAGIAIHYDEGAGGRVRNAHVGVIGLSSIPRRLPDVEAVLNGEMVSEALAAKAREVATEAVDPLEDTHASADYRRSLAGTLTARVLRAAAGIE